MDIHNTPITQHTIMKRLFSFFKKRTDIKKIGTENRPDISDPMHSFLHQSVENIMIVRADIVALEEHTPFDTVLKTFLKTGFDWIPVYRKSMDTICGTVSLHSILSLHHTDNASHWHRHINHVHFSPSSMTVRDAMIHTQHKNAVIFVVDEHGGIEGMVTKGCILREMVQLYATDEMVEEEMIISRDPLIVQGQMDMETFMEEFNAGDLREEGDEGRVNTLGGWLCSYLERVPLTGEIIHHSSGFSFEIKQATPRKIHYIAIVSMPKSHVV